MTVQEGRAYLASVLGQAEAEGPGTVTAGKAVPSGQAEALSLADVWFRYGQTRPDVLKGVFLTVRKGEHYCLLGSNGAGKSTLLEVITGALAPYRGRVRVCGEIRKRGKAMEASGRVTAMPQDPKLLFLSDTLREDFRAACRMGGVPKEMWDSRILDEARAWGIEGLLDRHPYDLSGGEKQKAAFVKVLLPGPSLVLLDEPAKGMDAAAKARLASGIRKLAGAGIGVMTVTHDVEFAAESADRVGMLYDGVIVSEDTPARFFTDNLFFTTAAASLTRGFLGGAVTVEAAVDEILRRCKGEPHA